MFYKIKNHTFALEIIYKLQQNSMEKVKISSDTLYKFLTEHNVKQVRIAEKMGISVASLTSCFKHQLINNGVPRNFTVQNINRMNVAISQIAAELRMCLLTFGSDKTYTNQRGVTYDPALVAPLKRIGKYMNLTALVARVLGWNQDKKETTIVSPSSKNYGNITREDADRINAELLSVAGVLSSYEVVADESPTQTAETKTDKKQKGKRMEDSSAYPWDDTALPLPERSRLFREQFPGGVLLFRVNGGYTAEGDDALLLQQIDSTISPYNNVETGLVTAWMDGDAFAYILPRLIAHDKRVMFTDMYKE